jgi:hypothetical protein
MILVEGMDNALKATSHILERHLPAKTRIELIADSPLDISDNLPGLIIIHRLIPSTSSPQLL